uniref:CSON009583 protein n=1 Tax=Culicoides sonorensis TaxID=179676 RepID=A0A336M0J8_CULSO
MEDNEIVWGKPTLEEIREYFTTPVTHVNPRSVLELPSSDSSIDLDDSFKAIIEERRRKAEEEQNKLLQKTPTTSNYKDIQTPGTANSIFRAFRTPGTRLGFEKTPSGLSMDSDQSSWMNCGEETFLNMEKMCENTILENTMEAEAVDRLLNEYRTEENSAKKSPVFGKCLNDMTQLNDIEAPSMMWDQTLLNANSPKASPMKLVHLNRPSTIIEESTIYNSSKEESKINPVNDTVIHSKDQKPEEQESADLSSQTSQNSSNASTESHISLNTTNNDDTFQTAKAPDTTNMTSNRTSYETANDQTLGRDTTTSSTKTLSDDFNVFPLKKKRNFYDAPFAKGLSISNTSNSTAASEDSLFNVKYEKNSQFLDSLDVIEVNDDDDDELLQEDSLLKDDENVSGDLLEIPEFNDTLEEMDFIMKHGMKVMEQQKAIQSKPASAQKSKPSTPNILKQKNLNRLAPGSDSKKNTPDTFKKPIAISRLPVPKSNSKKFNHIVSPIHAYIKDAPQYPLMTKQKGARTGLIDQLHDPNRRDTVYSQNNENLFTEDPSYKPAIPLKGVISAPKSQVYDARTPIKMPGGDKVHKLIGNHTPTVVKHEGRFKSYTNVQINANDTVDESFANLSVASGDVSIQVVKNVNRNY